VLTALVQRCRKMLLFKRSEAKKYKLVRLDNVLVAMTMWLIQKKQIYPPCTNFVPFLHVLHCI